MDLTIATLKLEAFLLVLVRVGTFLAIAPIFGDKSINARMRVLIAFCVSLAIFSSMDVALPEYESVLGYTVLVLKEAVVGLSLGFVSALILATLSVAGEFIDREIGFTMVSAFDPSSGGMTTITADFYNKIVCIVILVSNLHYFILRGAAQSFEYIPVGKVEFNTPVIYSSVIEFIGQYFSIGFLIAMPVFIGITMVNVILGVLAKSAPQMNMFAVGMQLKVFSGLLILSIIIIYVPGITNMLMERLQEMIGQIMGGFVNG